MTLILIFAAILKDHPISSSVCFKGVCVCGGGARRELNFSLGPGTCHTLRKLPRPGTLRGPPSPHPRASLPHRSPPPPLPRPRRMRSRRGARRCEVTARPGTGGKEGQCSQHSGKPGPSSEGCTGGSKDGLWRAVQAAPTSPTLPRPIPRLQAGWVIPLESPSLRAGFGLRGQFKVGAVVAPF